MAFRIALCSAEARQGDSATIQYAIRSAEPQAICPNVGLEDEPWGKLNSMTSGNLVFEKVGDITVTYPYLNIYFDVIDGYPFMEISVTDDKKLVFTISQDANLFPNSKPIELDAGQWREILEKAEVFLLEVVENEEACRDLWG